MKVKFEVPRNTVNIILNYKCKTGTIDDSNKCDNTSNADSNKLLSLSNINRTQELQKSKSADAYNNRESYNAHSKLFLRDSFTPTQGNQQLSYNRALESSIALMENHPNEFHSAITMGYTQDARDYTKILRTYPNLPIGASYDIHGENGIRQFAKDIGEEIKKYVGLTGPLSILNGQDNLEPFSDNILVVNDIGKIDKLMKESTIPEKLITYSGVDPRYFELLPKDSGAVFEISTFISSSRNEIIGKGFASYALKSAQEGWLSDDRSQFNPGTKYMGNEKTLIEFQLEKGTHAIATEPAQAFAWTIYNKPDKWGPQSKIRNKETDSQEELIINRKTKFEVIELKTSGNLKRLIVKSLPE